MHDHRKRALDFYEKAKENALVMPTLKEPKHNLARGI